MTTTTTYHAAVRGIAIQVIDSQIEGDLDRRGFLGISQDARKVNVETCRGSRLTRVRAHRSPTARTRS